MLNPLFQCALKPYWRAATIATLAVTLSACMGNQQTSSSVAVASSETAVSSSAPVSSSSLVVASSSVVEVSSSVVASSSVVMASSSVVASSSIVSSSSIASSSVAPSSSSIASSSSVAACNATTSAQYLKGEALYKNNLCTACHGATKTNGMTAGGAAQAIDVANAPYGMTNQSTMAAYIATGMKAYLPASCSGSETQCAADIAHYLQVATKVLDPCASQASSSVATSSSAAVGGILFEDDFESHTANAKPLAPWVSYYDGDPAQIANYVRISTAQSQSGSKSLNIKTENTGSFAYLDFNPSDVTADKLYVRAFWRASNGLGGSVNGHSDMIKLGNFIVNGNYNNNAGTTAIKYGEAKGTVGINILEHSDAIYPKGPSNGDEQLPKNTWVCLEILFDKNPANTYADTLTTWVDGRMVSEIKAANQAAWGAAWQNGPPPANWLENIFAGAISFGWQTYGGAGNDIYFDDLVIATEPVGCSYMPSGTR